MADASDRNPSESDWMEKVIGIGVAVAFPVVLLASFAVNLFGIGASRLEIVASALDTKLATDPPSEEWMVRGRVLYQGDAVQGAKVWAIARDTQGNRYAPKTAITDEFGEYKLEAIPKMIGGVPNIVVSEVSVFASASVSTKKDKGDQSAAETIYGEVILGIGGEGRTRWIKLPWTALVSIPTIFFLSLMLGLFSISPGSPWLKVQYFATAALAIVFTITMVAYISFGLYIVSVAGSPGDALSLGFATIFQGTYVEGITSEWLFSLTAPPPVTELKVTGFGAPLWVLLLSVFGSGVFTIWLVVGNIGEDLKLGDPAAVRALVQKLVKHQFFVLFSPLGAVIVYQLLVIGGSASQPVTVGLVAIAAGVALNAILNKAINAVTKLLES